MFDDKAGNLWRWCGLAAAVALLTLCVILLSSQAIMAEGSSPPIQISFSGTNADGDSRDGSPRPNPDYTVDLTYDVIWGLTDSGSVMTVTRSVGGGAYGACEADGVGFCWTSVYDSSGNGQPVDLMGDDTLLVYKDGGLAATIAPLTITGEIDVLDDEVEGNVTGTASLPFSVTVTLGDLGQMVTDAPRVTATVDGNGDFEADFGDASVDIGAHEMAQVQYQDAAGNTVQAYVYPSEVFRVDNWGSVSGYAEPGTQVTVTVYDAYPGSERWSDSDVWADWPHGTYKTGGEIDHGDVAEVELSDGTMMSVTAEAIYMWIDATTDQVTGTAPIGAPVRGYVWSAQQDVYEIVTDTAVGGVYTLDFGLDLDSKYWVYVAHADGEGDEVGIASSPAHIRAAPQFRSVFAMADGPEQAITYTLDLGEEITTTTGDCGPTNNCDGWGGELEAGDIITAELQSGLVMVMTVADLSAELDTANDRMLGTANLAGDIEANAWQWNGDRYPMNGDVFATATAASPFTATFSNFDIRDGMGGWWVAHFADSGNHRTLFAGMRDWQWETPHFEVNMPWGVGGIPPSANEVITAELYSGYGGALLGSTSNDHDDDAWRFWLDEFDNRIEPGNWVTVTSASGWSAGLEVPTLTLETDAENNLLFGEAPKSSVWIHHRWDEGDEDWAGHWVPVDGYVLDTGFFGHELNKRDQVDITYQAPNGNRVRAEAVWPQLFVDYGADWVQANYPAGHAFVVTATDSISDFVAARDSEWGGGWWAAAGFRTEWDDWADEQPDIMPGYEVEFVVDDGYTQTVKVGTITGTLDLDDNSISGEIYVPWFGGDLDVQCHPDTWWPMAFEYDTAAADGSSSYYCQWDKNIVDLSNMDDDIMVTYVEPDGNWVSNRFREYGVQIEVNYAHNWVQVNTEPDAEVVLTVEGKGTLVATANGEGRMESHQHQGDWTQGEPDFEPGDRITATAIGKMATIDPVGTIDGEVNRATDVVSGTIQAPFGSTELHVRCEIWTENGPPGIEFDDIPANGGEFRCDFGGEYDIQFEDTVSVRYSEPDGDQVINSWDEPRPNMQIEKWPEGGGKVMPGGPAVFTIQVSNWGDADAEGVVLTDTLPGSTDWLADSSGFTAGFDTGVVTWDVGPVAMDEQIRFQVVLTPATSWSEGSWLHNEVDVYAPYDNDDGNNNAGADVQVSDDSDDEPDLWVDKHPNPGDPYPGDAFLWEINYGNNGPVASGPVVLTDTLVAGTEVITWYSNNGYNLWTDESTAGEFVLKAPSLPGNWGDNIMLWLEVDPGLQPGSTLSNTVEITTAGESITDNNKHERYDVQVTDHSRRDVHVEKRFSGGSMVPGREMQYDIHLNNHGNRTVEVTLVDILPDGVSLERATIRVGETNAPFPPDDEPVGQAVWDESIGELLPGEWLNINLQVAIDKDVEPGTFITNCVEVTIDEHDDEMPGDNESCVVDRVSAPGTNIRVRKEVRWENEDRIQYDLYVENIGTSRIEDLELTDIWPAGTENPQLEQGHGPGFSEQSRDTVNRELVLTMDDDLDWGNTARIRLYLDLVQGGVQGQTFVNRIEASLDGDNYPGDNWAEVTAITGPDIFAEKWVSEGEPRPGEVVTFTVAFGNQNHWPWNTADDADLHITDTLPAGMSFVAATDPDNPSQPWDPREEPGNTVVWDWGSMGSDDRREFSLAVEFDASLQGGDVLTNVVEAYGDGPNNVEAVYENNVFELPVTLLGPGFDVTKTYVSSRAAGAPVTYTLTVENVGNEDGTQVVLADTLPTGVTYGDSDGVKSGDDITWTFAKIAPDGTSTGWFMGTLPCTTGDVTNSGYGVTGSDQGITTGSGTPVVFSIIAPTLTASFSQSAAVINLGDKVDFADTTTTNGGDIVAWGWDFGDGGTGTGAMASHTYVTPGAFDVTLTVTDSCGYSEDVTMVDAVTISQISVYLPAILKNH